MSKAKYQLIADDLREKIKTNVYPIGSVIPPELQLQKDYQVSRYTVRQAIALLVNEGYLRSEKGSGTYVEDTFKEEKSVQKPKKTIGVITTYLSDYIFPSIIRGIEQKLRESGYSLLLASTNNNYALEKESLEKMIDYGVDGLIVEPTKSNQYNPNLALYVSLRENNIPMVMINAPYEELDTSFLSMDDVQVGYLATKYLIDAGHKELLFLTKIDDLQGKYRMKGFIKACEESFVRFSTEDVLTFTTETQSEIPSQVNARLNNKSGITGIVCYNDQVASQLITALSESGYKIPEELSIIGTDDSHLRTFGNLQITTLSHPKEQLGEDAAQWIVKTIESGEVQPNIIYPTHVVEGNSVKKSRK
ncbi:MAG: GntR family transcriptional regulator [Enterococcus sp.]